MFSTKPNPALCVCNGESLGFGEVGPSPNFPICCFVSLSQALCLPALTSDRAEGPRRDLMEIEVPNDPNLISGILVSGPGPL